MKYYRFDLLFSYWIFIWYLLYILEIVDASPKLALIIGLVENAMLLFSMIFVKPAEIHIILIFLFINFWIKVVPFYTLYEEPIDYEEQGQNTLIVFSLYIAWLVILGRNVLDVQTNVRNSLTAADKVDPETTPTTAMLLDIWKVMKTRATSK